MASEFTDDAEFEAWVDEMTSPTPCKCDAGACPRMAVQDGYCPYCVRMFPCDHPAMDRAGRISL